MSNFFWHKISNLQIGCFQLACNSGKCVQVNNPRISRYQWRFAHFMYWIFIHSVFCLTTGPKLPPKRCLHIVRSRAFYFKWQYPLLSLRSSNSFLRLLPRLLATFVSPFIFPSITCFRRQFLRKMWPIQLALPFSYFV